MISGVFFLISNFYSSLEMLGLLFKTLASFFFYKSIIDSTLNKPYTTLFRVLNKNKQELASSNRKLKELQEVRNNFITVITHDLKQPLTPIMGYAEFLQKDLKEKDRIKYSNIIKTNSEKMLEMINNMLHVMKSDVKELNYNFIKNNFYTLVNEIINNKMSAIDLKKIKITKNIENIEFEFDYNRIKEAISNLLDNAIKFTKDIIVIKAYQDSHTIYLSIRDNGIGIKEKDMPNLFKRFYQTEDGKKIGGSGIGLSIVKDIINKHNGKISVKSIYNKGTEFSITLPKFHADKK
jgi:signal transduction histidine kinase